jgi:AcrR family transcriptional regulator
MARGPRVLRNQPPMDAGQVIDAAVRLTHLYGLEQWTIRQLGAELEVWPAVIYHHVGDRDAVVAEVVDQVVGLVRPLDENLPWRQAFARMTTDLRIVLRRHPGVARWLAVTGPVVPAALRLLDRGVRLLARAGLGDEAAIAYTVVLDSALLVIAHEEDLVARSSLTEVREVLAAHRDSPGLAAMASYLDTRDFDERYRYTIDRVLDGIAGRAVEPGAAPGDAT